MAESWLAWSRKAVLASLVLLLGSCGGGGGGPVTTSSNGGTTNGGSGGVFAPTIQFLGFTPKPSRIAVRNGDLYWLDASDTPLNRYSPATASQLPLVTTVPYPERAVSDGSDIYWVSGGGLYKTSLSGGGTTLVDQGERDSASGVTAAIVMDSTYVYWANTVSSMTCSPACIFTIRQVPKAGGTAVTLTTTNQAIVALGISSGFIFWEEEGIGPVNSDGSIGSEIKKVPTSGGNVTVLVNGLLNGLISPPPPNTLEASWYPRGGIATDGSDVYFSDADFVQSYRLMKVSASGGSITVMSQVNTGDASNFLRDMQIDSANVYWVDATSLNSIPKSGGSYTILASALPSPVSLALSGGTLYWLETVCCAAGQKGTIETISTTGGTPFTLKSGIDSPVSISLDAMNVYWIEGGPIGSVEGFGAIKSVPLAGGSDTVWMESASGGPFGVDDTYLYFANAWTIKRVPIAGGPVERLAIGDFNVIDVATDGSFIYWIEDPTSVVRKMPVNGGPITTLATGTGPAGPLRLDANYVYWMDHEDTIKRVPKSGGTTTTIVGPIAGLLTDFAVSGNNVFLSQWDGALIQSAPIGGGAITTLASPHADQTRRIATDGISVYWVDQTSVGKVPVTGGIPQYFLQTTVVSDPSLAGGICVDATNVYWTQTATDAIVMATPK